MSYLIRLTPEHPAIVHNALVLYQQMRIGDWDKLFPLCSPSDFSSFAEFSSRIAFARGVLCPDLSYGQLYQISDFDDAIAACELLNKIDGQLEFVLENDEAKLLRATLEIFARLRMGQWDELLFLCVPPSGYLADRQEFVDAVMKARKIVYPDLHVYEGHSYGVGKFQDADLAWELQTVLRHRISWTEHPEGGFGVCFDKPISFSGNKLASCEVFM